MRRTTRILCGLSAWIIILRTDPIQLIFTTERGEKK